MRQQRNRSHHDRPLEHKEHQENQPSGRGWRLGFYRESKEQRQRMKEMGKQFRPPRKHIFIILVFLHAAIASCWGIAYVIMGAIYRTWFPQFGHGLLRQYLTVFLCFFVLFLLMTLVRLFYAPVRQQMDWFLQMINAMKELSKGNFNVSLEMNKKFIGQFGPLVSGFNEMAVELNQMETMRQEFISNVSHEIQSPLTSIAGFARALQNDSLSPETRKHYLGIIETESKRLSRISDNLLKLTSLESNQHPFEAKPYRLDRQIRHIILSCEPLWQTKSIEMDVELPELTISADEDLMSQVWVNLLHNSIKFTPEGGTIRLRLARKQDLIQLDLIDSGKGISDEALPHLFERFYKEDKARDRSGGGSGLGLSIVQKIVHMHGGEVFAGNEPGLGAIFTIQLPLK